jgi:hypothetical protein
LAARAADWSVDDRTAADLRDWLEILNGFSSLAALDVRFAEGAVPPPQIAGQSSTDYGRHLYRRPTPVDQIPPDLLHLRFE